jgi:hypothetical protein
MELGDLKVLRIRNAEEGEILVKQWRDQDVQIQIQAQVLANYSSLLVHFYSLIQVCHLYGFMENQSIN